MLLGGRWYETADLQEATAPRIRKLAGNRDATEAVAGWDSEEKRTHRLQGL